MPKFTKTDEKPPMPLPQFAWIGLAAVTIFAYFFGLTIPFVGPDEARYAQVAREMFERGDWITPTLGGFNWFEKPALLYWLQIASYNVFGVSEFAARFGPAIFGLGTVFSLWIMGRFISKSQISNLKSKIIPAEFANWLALIAATTLGIMVFARGASFDIIVTFPLTAALVSFFIYDQGADRFAKKKYLPLFLFYVFIGISVLAKGLIGGVFPFAIVSLFYLLSRRLPSRAFLLSLFWGIVVAGAVISIWYLPMYQRHGFAFVDEFFLQHHFQRFTTNKYQHPQPFYFFFWVLPLMTLPWLPFFIAALVEMIKSAIYRISSSPLLPVSSSPLLLFSTAWLIMPLAFFSFSGSKLPGYILPAVPAAIVLTALFVFKLVQNSKKWRRAILMIAASTFGVALLLLIFVIPRFADTDSVKSLFEAANQRGYASNPVLMLHTISHNAEFYAAGRLLRDGDGKLRRLSTISEVETELMAENGQAVLVLVPSEYLSQLTRQTNFTSEFLKDNGELAIAAVSPK